MWKNLLCVTILLFSGSLIASSLDFSCQEIVDKKSPKNPVPAISDVIQEIQEKSNKQLITELNIQNNYITSAGASKLLEYVIKTLPNLRSINLSNNRIEYNSTDYQKFEENLIKILRKETFQKIDLSINHLDIDWRRDITPKITSDANKKINSDSR